MELSHPLASNSLSPIRHQAITWIDGDEFPIGPQEQNSMRI